MTLPSIDPATNRFANAAMYQFDAVGNLIRDAHGRQFVFNGDNKQVQVRDAQNNVVGEYRYDGNGKRIKKITASETVVFVYDGFSKLIGEYSTDGPPAEPMVHYTATDPLGSPRVLTNENGAIVSRRDFMPFGEEIVADQTYRKAADDYGVGDNVRQKFTGYERDEETGLDFAEARYYHNTHGRFTAVDPLLASGKSANPQTFNRYSYVSNNPQNFVDPFGLERLYAADGRFLGKFGDSNEIRIVKKAEIERAEKALQTPELTNSMGILTSVIETGSYGVFNNADDAANAWGQAYNRQSIRNGQEMGSTIFEVEIDGTAVITYSEPDTGTNDGVNVSPAPTGTKAIADIHSHGKYEKGYDNNNFSAGDKADNDNKGLVGYITTPDGSLKKYDPKTKTETVVNIKQPSDPNDPDRKNKID